MSFEKQLDILKYKLNQDREHRQAYLERFRHEIEFAAQFAKLMDKKDWENLVLEATEHVDKALAAGGSIDAEKLVGEAEKILAPIGKAAKEYTIHCAGHAHIDMNWMWPWPETVNVTHDTFSTVDKLMDDFPEFRFSQSQASTYIAMQEYCPEIFEMIKKRVKEGKWEVTASMWVEGDKNIISGESLCRHLLYSRQYFAETMGMKPEDVKIDWSPDTFGHAHTLPSILSRGGVTRYYHMRTGPGPWLYKWRSPDGSEITVYNDKDRHGYNGPIYPEMAVSMIPYLREVKDAGVKDFLMMYGVGDHGGGPTRRDLRRFREIANWPVYPTVKLSTTDAFFTAVEAVNPKLPVIDKDLNFIFEGCYTAQSNIKRANRVSEIILPEVETMAAIAGSIDKMDYPGELLRRAWRWTLFNHFHDILPGSGVHATYEYSQGLFQEIQATANSVRTRALRKLASNVDTSFAAPEDTCTFSTGFGDGLGAGAGDPGIPGRVTAWNAGAACAEPVLIYNQKPWPRSETVFAKVWNKPLTDDRVIVKDAAGKEMKGQVVARGHYWGHEFATVAFRADIPALGYKTYAIDSSPVPVQGEGARIARTFIEGTESMIPEVQECGVMENEYLRVEIDFPSGAIKHLIDKETGYDYVPEGKLLGAIEVCREAPRGMSAWSIGQIAERTPLTANGQTTIALHGPNRVAMRVKHNYKNSRVTVEVGLNAGSRMVDFKLNTRWVEIGTPEYGVPMLRALFPVNVNDGIPTYEIPFGSQQRKQTVQEIPALKWADLSGETDKGAQGITLVNDSKYGHSCVDDTLRLTLLRSSYDPDPLPEVADHEIKFAVIAHRGACDVVAATREGEQFNSPMAIVSTTVRKGTLPSEKSFIEVLTPNVFISTVKKAEDSDALVIRFFEMEGKDTEAKIRISDLVKPGAAAVETDVLERPVTNNTAKMAGDTMTVKVPKFGQATVKVG